MVCSRALGFLATFTITNALGRVSCGNYFAVTGNPSAALEEADENGENQSVEFKWGFAKTRQGG